MKTIFKPTMQKPPPPRQGWYYDQYFMEQLARSVKQKADNNPHKIAIG